MKYKVFLFLIFVITILLRPAPSKAFQYAGLPSDNLIQNPWFRANCKYSAAGWQTNLWAGGQKTQDPTDENCSGNWNGTAARWADQNANGGFTPNTNAILWQVVPANPNSKTLHFHSLIVAHRVNQYKAEIYGSNSSTGPWTSVWVPFNILNCLTLDCVNNTPPGDCNSGNRECLWDAVTDYFLGSLSPLTKTISQGYPFYKVEFVLNYPNPNPNLATGDVGGKLARVYFKVSGGGSGPTLTPPQATVTKIPTVIITDTFKPGDANNDNKVDGLDYIIWLNNYNKNVSNGSSSGDFNNSGKVDGLDYIIWLNNYLT